MTQRGEADELVAEVLIDAVPGITRPAAEGLTDLDTVVSDAQRHANDDADELGGRHGEEDCPREVEIAGTAPL